jgi:hypothetical protein
MSSRDVCSRLSANFVCLPCACCCRYVTFAVEVDTERPVLVDKYLDRAVELDVDALCDKVGKVLGTRGVSGVACPTMSRYPGSKRCVQKRMWMPCVTRWAGGGREVMVANCMGLSISSWGQDV